MSVIDLEQARLRRESAQAQGMVGELITATLDELGAIEALLQSERPLSEGEAHRLSTDLAAVLRTGLHGTHARTWAASLLARLGAVAGPALCGDDARVVEEARAALAAFDAVAYGTTSPADMRALLIECELKALRLKK